MSNPKASFVFAVTGERHVAAANVALRFLKRVTRNDIVVVQSRSPVRVAHDQVVDVELPPALDDHAASLLIKTNLLSHVRGAADQFCYLDSDVMAINEGVDRIFEHRRGLINFAQDHASVDRFSSWAVNCGCQEAECNHLREALLCKFGVDIVSCDWRLWNGGVFLFDEASEPFLQTWHAMTRDILADTYWRTRDQGALAGAAWAFGLQDQATIPSSFNLIVDCLRGLSPEARVTATAADSFVRQDYSLAAEAPPHFIHLINGGVGRWGWRNWDDIEALLTPQGAKQI